MSYCTAYIIGIYTGGVFSGRTNMDSLKQAVADTAGDCEKLAKAASQLTEFNGGKGSIAMMGGVFNYLDTETVSNFCLELSRTLRTTVYATGHDMETGGIKSAAWREGELYDPARVGMLEYV
jgi:hypothetical protein